WFTPPQNGRHNTVPPRHAAPLRRHRPTCEDERFKEKPMSSGSSTFSVPPGRLAPTRLRQTGLMLAGTLVLAASAQISIPMWPVPLTLELYAVLLVGAFFGWRLGAATVAAWLLEGALGLPVFAHGTGSVASFVGDRKSV